MTKILAVALTLAAGLALWWAVADGPLREPEDALRDFYETEERAED